MSRSDAYSSHHAPRDDRALAAMHRDAALSRVGRTRRWMIAGAAGLTAGLAALASAVAPGRSFGAKPAPQVTAARAPARASAADQPLPAEASPSSLGLTPPSQAPQSAAPPQPAPAPAPAPGPDPSQSAPAQAAPAPAPAPAPAAVSGGS